MTDMIQIAIVLGTVQTLRNEGSWCGETHVQKTVFLCQELFGIPSKFRFILYKHGPYSFGLSEGLQGLIADHFLCVLARPPYGPTLAVADTAKPLISRVQNHEKFDKQIRFVARRVGVKGVADLERIATAVYVNKKHGAEIGIEDRVQHLVALKPHVSAESARTAFAEADAMTVESRECEDVQ